MVLFGQIIIGPPGSGKTTYCHGISMFLHEIERKYAIVNLDFANDKTPYHADIDVRELISIEEVMSEYDLGPNGGLIYCMEYLLSNYDWLENKLLSLDCVYVLFDCPGQVELFTHYTFMEDIIHKLQQSLDCRLCTVHLIDSFYCSQPATFISAVLLVASTMLRLGLPHINILSKVDLLSQYGQLPFTFDYYTDLTDMMPLTRYVNESFLSDEELQLQDRVMQEENEEVEEDKELKTIDKKDNNIENKNIDSNNIDISSNIVNIKDTVIPQKSTSSSSTPSSSSSSSSSILQSKRHQQQQKKKKSSYKKMTSAICEVLNDMNLISFLPLNIQDIQTVARVIANVDKANGYSFAAVELDTLRQQQQSTHSSNPNTTSTTASTISNTLFRMASQNTELHYFRSLDIYEKYTYQPTTNTTTSEHLNEKNNVNITKIHNNKTM